MASAPERWGCRLCGEPLCQLLSAVLSPPIPPRYEVRGRGRSRTGDKWYRMSAASRPAPFRCRWYERFPQQRTACPPDEHPPSSATLPRGYLESPAGIAPASRRTSTPVRLERQAARATRTSIRSFRRAGRSCAPAHHRDGLAPTACRREREISPVAESDRRNARPARPDRGHIASRARQVCAQPAAHLQPCCLAKSTNSRRSALSQLGCRWGEDLEPPRAAHRRWASTAVGRVQTSAYTLTKNLRMRSRPRSRFSAETAYETRMWSWVPKPSPGTTARCASRKSFRATSVARWTRTRVPRRNSNGSGRRRATRSSARVPLARLTHQVATATGSRASLGHLQLVGDVVDRVADRSEEHTS